MVAGLWATCCCDGKGGRGGGGLTTVLCRGWEGGGFLHPYCRGGGVQEAQPVGASWMFLHANSSTALGVLHHPTWRLPVCGLHAVVMTKGAGGGGGCKRGGGGGTAGWSNLDVAAGQLA
jgi:hypothetical protein